MVTISFRKPKTRKQYISSIFRTKDGKAIKGDDHIVITSEGKVYKLEIAELVMEDAGVYKCTISNRLGEKSQETKFDTISQNEFRKPTVNADLKPLVINKNENGTLTLMLVADPVPEIVWYAIFLSCKIHF